MTGKVDKNYWNDYFQTYNAKRYDDLVNNYYTDNPTFQNPKYQLAGRRAIAAFFQEQHLEVTETLTPITVIITPEVAALELDAVFSSTKDLPQFYVFPLKSGVESGWGWRPSIIWKGTASPMRGFIGCNRQHSPTEAYQEDNFG